MNGHDHSSGQQSNDEQLSQNTKSTQNQGGATIDTCTMDPCPMKAGHDGGKPEKCPQCGMEDEHKHEIH